MRKYWTTHEHELMMQAVAERATADEIAEELRRTTSSVAGRLHRKGVKVGRSAPPDLAKRAEVMGMLATGLPLSEIARIRGIGHHAVWKMVRKLEKEGLVRRVGGYTSTVKYVPTARWTMSDEAGVERKLP